MSLCVLFFGSLFSVNKHMKNNNEFLPAGVFLSRSNTADTETHLKKSVSSVTMLKTGMMSVPSSDPPNVHETRPTSKFGESLFSSFSLILLTNQPTDGRSEKRPPHGGKENNTCFNVLR